MIFRIYWQEFLIQKGNALIQTVLLHAMSLRYSRVGPTEQRKLIGELILWFGLWHQCK